MADAPAMSRRLLEARSGGYLWEQRVSSGNRYKKPDGIRRARREKQFPRRFFTRAAILAECLYEGSLLFFCASAR